MRLHIQPWQMPFTRGCLRLLLQIAEMRTGEGKTLVAVLPAFLNALSGALCCCAAVLFCADALSGRQLPRHALLAGYALCHAFWPSAAVWYTVGCACRRCAAWIVLLRLAPDASEPACVFVRDCLLQARACTW